MASRTKRVWIVGVAGLVGLSSGLAAGGARAEAGVEARDAPAEDVDARAVTIGVNAMSLVHEGSNGVAIAFPDVCMTPAPGGPVPVPYPNIGPNASELGPGRYKLEGGGELVVTKVPPTSGQASGDDAGTEMGVVSSRVKARAELVNFSFDVAFEGKQAVRVGDPTAHNQERVVFSRSVSQGESPVVQLEDGTWCGVCMRNRRITAIYRLQPPARLRRYSK